MKIVIYTDLHCFGPNQVMQPKEFSKDIEGEIQAGNKILLLGDNVDLIRCKNSEYNQAYEFYFNLQTFVLNYNSVSYVSGNHEGGYNQIVKFFNLKSSTNLLSHGDMILDITKYGKFRSKDKAVSAAFFNILKIKHELASKFKRKKLTSKRLNKIYKFVQKTTESSLTNYTIDNVLCGHLHPEKLEVEEIQIKYNFKVWCFPQGKTVIDAKDLAWK